MTNAARMRSLWCCYDAGSAKECTPLHACGAEAEPFHVFCWALSELHMAGSIPISRLDNSRSFVPGCYDEKQQGNWLCVSGCELAQQPLIT